MKAIEEFLKYRSLCELCNKRTTPVWYVGDINVKHEQNDHMITLFDLGDGTQHRPIITKRGIPTPLTPPPPNHGFENCELHINSESNKFITYNPDSPFKILYYPPIGCTMMCGNCKAYSFTFGTVSIVSEHSTELQPFKLREIFNYKLDDKLYSVIINYMEETTSLFKINDIKIEKLFGMLEIEVPTIMFPYKNNIAKTIDRLKKLQLIK